jgi:predicted nucleotidyltransferase
VAPNPLDLLFGAYRQRVLGRLLSRPDEAVHVRELARATGVPAGSLHRELKFLADAGLLLRESAGNQVLYRANQASPLFPELESIFRKAEADAPRRGQPKARATLRIQQPRDPMTPPASRALHSPKAAYAVPARAKLRVPMGKLAALCRRHGIRKLSLFGSASRNELRADSDVDLMVEFGEASSTTLFDFPQLKEELSALFSGRQIDLVSPEVMRNPFRRRSIEPDLQVLYESG